MQDKDETITKLKANLFDKGEQIAELSGILQAIVNVLQLQANEEGNITPNMLVDEVTRLKALTQAEYIPSEG